MSGRNRGLGSRSSTGRPRKVALQTHEHPTADRAEPAAPAESAESADGAGARRLTVGLVIAIVVLGVIGVAEILLLVREDQPTVSAARPVVVGDATRAEAVRAAAQATEEILSTSFDTYDEQAEQATAKMTDTFAEEYRETSEGIRDRFLAQRTKLQIKAVGQSVVQASPEQAQVLLFLDQYVEKRVKGQPRTDFAQYRALVTVVQTDGGWLVSDIETQ